MWWRKEENCVYRGGDSPTLLSSLRNVFVSSTCPPIPLAVCQIPVLLGRLPDPVLWTDCPDPLGRCLIPIPNLVLSYYLNGLYIRVYRIDY